MDQTITNVRTEQVNVKNEIKRIKKIEVLSTSSASLDTASNSSGTKSNDFYSQLSKSESTDPLQIITCDWKILLDYCEQEEWINILMTEIVHFNNVDLDLLTTNAEKTTFFINIYNLMMMHMMISLVQVIISLSNCSHCK